MWKIRERENMGRGKNKDEGKVLDSELFGLISQMKSKQTIHISFFMDLTTPLSGTGYIGLCSQQRGKERNRDRQGDGVREGGEGERVRKRE